MGAKHWEKLYFSYDVDVPEIGVTTVSKILWCCPNCNQASLKVDEIFFLNQIGNKGGAISTSAKYCSSENPTRYGFYGTLKCSISNCNRKVAMSGEALDLDAPVNIIPASIPGQSDVVLYSYLKEFYPKYFTPSLKIINVPGLVPANVKLAIEESFRLFFLDCSSCANKLRTAVELLLTSFKVKRFTVSNGKRKSINLHSRLDIFKNSSHRFSKYADNLLAIKWIGNKGSHSSDNIKHKELLETYDILDHVLGSMYVDPIRRINALTDRINKNKG